MFIARMLVDKGVFEFISAANSINMNGIIARFILIGSPDHGNPASISADYLNRHDGQFGVEWWGQRTNIHKILKKAHIICLPSYREGLPKTLLEAAAAGLPIVTTDTPGCREVVLDGENGFLVPIKNHEILAEALLKLIVDKSLRTRMGKVGRMFAEEKFSSNRIVKETLAIYNQIYKMDNVSNH